MRDDVVRAPPLGTLTGVRSLEFREDTDTTFETGAKESTWLMDSTRSTGSKIKSLMSPTAVIENEKTRKIEDTESVMPSVRFVK